VGVDLHLDIPARGHLSDKDVTAMNVHCKAGDYEARHNGPVWRHRATFVIAADISEKPEKREWEQLWVRRLSESRFEIWHLAMRLRLTIRRIEKGLLRSSGSKAASMSGRRKTCWRSMLRRQKSLRNLLTFLSGCSSRASSRSRQDVRPEFRRLSDILCVRAVFASRWS
jgi:hypothetical protein